MPGAIHAFNAKECAATLPPESDAWQLIGGWHVTTSDYTGLRAIRAVNQAPGRGLEFHVHDGNTSRAPYPDEVIAALTTGRFGYFMVGGEAAFGLQRALQAARPLQESDRERSFRRF